MAGYPIFLNLTARRVVLIGAGSVALRKAQALLAAGARLVVIADRLDPSFIALAKNDKAELIESKYSKDYLSCAVLVIAATNDPQLNRRIYEDCQQLDILCNVVDQPKLCDFFVPAVVERGGLQIAVGTGGGCPAYAAHLRKKLEAIFTEEHGKFLDELQAVRRQIIEQIGEPAQRKALLAKLADDESFEYFEKKGSAAWCSRAGRIIKDYQP